MQIPDNIGMLLVSFLQNEIQLVSNIRSVQSIVDKVQNSERQNDLTRLARTNVKQDKIVSC